MSFQHRTIATWYCSFTDGLGVMRQHHSKRKLPCSLLSLILIPKLCHASKHLCGYEVNWPKGPMWLKTTLIHVWSELRSVPQSTWKKDGMIADVWGTTEVLIKYSWSQWSSKVPSNTNHSMTLFHSYNEVKYHWPTSLFPVLVVLKILDQTVVTEKMAVGQGIPQDNMVC